MKPINDYEYFGKKPSWCPLKEAEDKKEIIAQEHNKLISAIEKEKKP